MDYNSKLYIHQLISTIQGEGDLIGVPSILLRLAGCNCRCSWCDTAWSWTSKGTIEITSENIDNWLKELNRFNNKTCRNLMITGGEPFLYADNPLFNKLLRYSNFETIEIETNGSLITNDHLKNLPYNVKLNISPKLDEKWYTLGTKNFHHMIVMRDAILSYKNSIFKFVDDPQYTKDVEDFIKQMNIPNNKIYMMPLTPIRSKYSDKRDFLDDVKISSLKTLRYCIEKGYTFVPRLHLYLFDNEEEKI